MPIVPVFRPQIDQQGVPNVGMRSSVDTSAVQDINNRAAHIINQNIQSGLDDIQNAVQQRAYIAAQEQEQAGKDRAAESFNSVREKQIELTVGQDGFMNQRGGQVLNRQSGLPLHQEYLKKLDDFAASAFSNLTDHQKALAMREYANARATFTSQALRHEADETQNYRVGINTDGIAVEGKYAAANWNNPHIVGDAIRRANDHVESIGRLTGKPVEELRQKALDDIHFNVFSAALDNKQAGYAIQFMDANRQNISQPTLHKMAGMLDSLREKQDNTAERAAGEAWRQVASGIPARQDNITNWSNATAGTKYQADYTAAMRAHDEFAAVREQPIEKQQAFLDGIDNRLHTQGGTPQEQTYLNSMRAAVDANIKNLTTNPLEYQRTRGQEPVPAVDFNRVFSNPNGATELAQAVIGRVDQISALRKQFGPQVPTDKILEPYEASVLGKALDGAEPAQQLQMLSTLYKGTGDNYDTVLKQLSKDTPVIARAGELATIYGGMHFPGEHFWSDSVQKPSRDVAETVLAGRKLLSEGQAKLISPGVATLSQWLNDRVGSEVYAGRADIADRDFSTFQAYYLGAAQKAGLFDPSMTDDKIALEAMRAVVGDPINYNGRAVIPPLNLSENDFKDAVKQQLRPLAANIGQDVETLSDHVQLMQIGDNLYRVVVGNQGLYIGNKPAIIRIGQ